MICEITSMLMVRRMKKAQITSTMGWEVIALMLMIALGILAAIIIVNHIFPMGVKF